MLTSLASTWLPLLAQNGGGDAAAAAGGIVVLLLSCMMLLVGLLALIFWVWMLIDCVRRDFDGNEKIVWVLIIVLLNWLGAVIYFFVGRSKGRLPAG